MSVWRSTVKVSLLAGSEITFLSAFGNRPPPLLPCHSLWPLEPAVSAACYRRLKVPPRPAGPESAFDQGPLCSE